MIPALEYPFRAKLIGSTVLSPRFEHVVHITRCPLRQIASLTAHRSESYHFLWKYMEAWNYSAITQNEQLQVWRCHDYCC